MNQDLPAMLDIWQKTLYWQPKDRQIEQYSQLYQAIVEGNQKLNLTRITEPTEFWEKHLWDSLVGVVPFFVMGCSLARLENKNTLKDELKIVDIGTGAGFPGLPIAIANPQWSITMVDSTRKKVTFIQNAIAKLQIYNAIAIVNRAETLGRESSHREQYDLALIRAVGKPSVCAEYVLPLVKVGGFAVLYRGHWEEADTKNLKSATKKLGSEVTHIQPISTPISESIRHCIYLYKHSPISDKYPRQVGIPNQQPL